MKKEQDSEPKDFKEYSSSSTQAVKCNTTPIPPNYWGGPFKENNPSINTGGSFNTNLYPPSLNFIPETKVLVSTELILDHLHLIYKITSNPESIKNPNLVFESDTYIREVYESDNGSMYLLAQETAKYSPEKKATYEFTQFI